MSYHKNGDKNWHYSGVF